MPKLKPGSLVIIGNAPSSLLHGSLNASLAKIAPCAFGLLTSSCIPRALTVAGCYVPFTDIGSALMKRVIERFLPSK
jgi:hypothetical protein